MEATEVVKLAELEDRHWWYQERRALLRRMVSAAFPDGPAERVAVDVGSAAGGNTRVLRDLGMFAVPIEFGADGAGIARQRGLAAVRGDACRLPVTPETLDLVVAFDVLEHIDDHDSALRSIHRVLRPGGVLLVAVPADMALWSAHDDAVGHVRRYSREQLVEALRAAELRVDSVRSWNVLLRPLVAFRRRRSQASDLSELNAAANLGLRAVVMAERAMPWLRGRRGVSLLVVARRPDDI